MRKITEGLASKSEKMGPWRRPAINEGDRNFLGTRYQFVRNVLVQDEAREAKKAAAMSGGTHLAAHKLRLGPDGRVLIPAAFREALGLSERRHAHRVHRRWRAYIF